MARPLLEPLRLPQRLRLKTASADTAELGRRLSARIAGLPGTPPCELTAEHLAIRGLHERERYQVMARGWGRLSCEATLVALPRDEDELDVCWQLVQRAHARQGETTAAGPPFRLSPLPSFSRTTHQ